MIGFFSFLLLASAISLVIFLILLIINAIKHRGKLKSILGIVISIVVFITSAISIPIMYDPSVNVSNTSTPIPTQNPSETSAGTPLSKQPVTTPIPIKKVLTPEEKSNITDVITPLIDWKYKDSGFSFDVLTSTDGGKPMLSIHLVNDSFTDINECKNTAIGIMQKIINTQVYTNYEIKSISFGFISKYKLMYYIDFDNAINIKSESDIPKNLTLRNSSGDII